MFFAHRTRQWLRIVFAAGAACAVLAATAAVIFPRAGVGILSSWGWWLRAIPVGLLAYVVLELFGTWVLGRAFWQRMPSWARVLLLVTLIACCAVGAVFVSPFVVNCGPRN